MSILFFIHGLIQRGKRIAATLATETVVGSDLNGSFSQNLVIPLPSTYEDLCSHTLSKS